VLAAAVLAAAVLSACGSAPGDRAGHGFLFQDPTRFAALLGSFLAAG
jgi:hypothetical protein